MQSLVSATSFLLMLLKAFQVSPVPRLNGNNISTSSQGVWSNELTKRLKAHSCEPGAIYENTTLLHGLRAGTFTELGRAKDVEVCVLQCCETHHCELALFMNHYCHGITCYSQQHCTMVPALGNNGGMVAVFLHKPPRANATSPMDQEVNQSKTGKPFKKSASKFVFYPVDTDDSEDLAFSVNLRKIASHYTDNEKIKRILTAKADEHLKTSKDKERKSPESRNLEKTDSRSEEERNKSSALDQFFSRDKVSSMRKNQPVSHGDTFRRKKKDDVNGTQWNSKLLKGTLSSSSVALLIVILILLAMSTKRTKRSQ